MRFPVRERGDTYTYMSVFIHMYVLYIISLPLPTTHHFYSTLHACSACLFARLLYMVWQTHFAYACSSSLPENSTHVIANYLLHYAGVKINVLLLISSGRNREQALRTRALVWTPLCRRRMVMRDDDVSFCMSHPALCFDIVSTFAAAAASAVVTSASIWQ